MHAIQGEPGGIVAIEMEAPAARLAAAVARAGWDIPTRANVSAEIETGVASMDEALKEVMPSAA